MTAAAPTVRPIGSNPTLIWGMTSTERLRRIAAAQGMAFGHAHDGPALLAAASHVFEPAWLRFMAERPGEVLTLDGEQVIAHVTSPAGDHFPEGLSEVRAEDHRLFYNEALRKREEPVLEKLEPANVRMIDRKTCLAKRLSNILREPFFILNDEKTHPYTSPILSLPWLNTG